MLKIEYKDHIGYENKRLENELHSRMAAYRASVGGEDLTMMQCWIIRFLYEHEEEEVYQRDIEAEFSIARSTATGILKLMEKKGYIRRVSVERDARLKKAGTDCTWREYGRRNHSKYQSDGNTASSGNLR